MISVIVPVYNTKDYLDACIGSIVSQTERDIEIILVDDMSTDGSAALLDEWESKDKRIVVIHKDINTGVSDSRNLALKRAEGEFIAFVDSDDWLEPDMLERMRIAMEKTGADVSFCGYERDDGKGKKPDCREDTLVSVDDALRYCIPRRDRRGISNDLFIWDKMFRRSLVYEEGSPCLFQTDLHFCEDVTWLFQVLLKATAVVFVPIQGYHYRVSRNTNATSQLRSYRDIAHARNALTAHKAVWELVRDRAIGNDAYRTVLYYQRIAIMTAINVKDWTACRTFKKGYLSGLIGWGFRNRSLFGLGWSCNKAFEYLLKIAPRAWFHF